MIAIGIRLHVACAAGGVSQLRPSEAFQEGVRSLLLLDQAPVSPFSQSHHQADQSDMRQEWTFVAFVVGLAALHK